MPRFHLNEDLLADYASGSLPAPVSMLVATHLTLCHDCRGMIENFEAVGGALLEEIDPVAMTADALEVALDAASVTPVEKMSDDVDLRRHDESGTSSIPLVLSRALDGPIDGLVWKRRARGIGEVEIPSGDERYSASLLRIEPGVSIPNHSHEGEEITLVLHGGFTDAAGHYGRGDVCHASAEVAHAPVADPGEPCLCLVVADGSMKLTGLVGRMLNPFIRL